MRDSRRRLRRQTNGRGDPAVFFLGLIAHDAQKKTGQIESAPQGARADKSKGGAKFRNARRINGLLKYGGAARETGDGECLPSATV